MRMRRLRSIVAYSVWVSCGNIQSSPAAQQDFKTRLHDITTSLNSIQHYVDIVSTTLSGDPCVEDLLHDWNKITKKFTNKRWKLKETSAEIDVFVEKLATIYLPQVPGYLRLCPAGDVKESLDEFHSDYKALDHKSKKQGRRFDKFIDLVNEFKKKCEDFGNGHEDHVAELKSEISELHRQKEEIMLRIREKEGELDKRQSVLRTLRQPRLIITHFINNRLKLVVNRLTVFYEIWAAGDQDIQDLSEYVVRPTRESVPLPLSLYQHPGSPVYTVIRKAMQIFAISAVPQRLSRLPIDDVLDVVLSQQSDTAHGHGHNHDHDPPEDIIF